MIIKNREAETCKEINVTGGLYGLNPLSMKSVDRLVENQRLSELLGTQTELLNGMRVVRLTRKAAVKSHML